MATSTQVAIGRRLKTMSPKIEVNGMAYKVELEDQPKVSHVVKRVAPAASEPTTAAPKPCRQTQGCCRSRRLCNCVSATRRHQGIYVKEGQQVKAADVVCILEAMKMGNEIHAGKDGVVKSINVAKEDSVLEGTTIMVIG